MTSDRSFENLTAIFLDKSLTPEVKFRLFENQLKEGADPNAIENGQPIIFTLLNPGNLPGYKLDTAYIIKYVSLLIDHNANLNVTNKTGDTPLALSALFGYRDLVQLLVENGASVNMRNDDGETPLALAVGGLSSNHKEIVKYLMMFDANPLIKDNIGNTAFDIALNMKAGEMFEILDKMSSFRQKMALLYLAFAVSDKNSNIPDLPLEIILDIAKYIVEPIRGNFVKPESRKKFADTFIAILSQKNIQTSTTSKNEASPPKTKIDPPKK